MEMSQKQLQLVREALASYKEQIDRATQTRHVDDTLVRLTAPYIEAKRQEIDSLSTMVDVLLEKEP